MIVRREQPPDVAQVRAVVGAAFARPETGEATVEVRLLDQLREDPGWIPALSLVAIEGSDTVIGHVVCTRADIGGRPVVGLGPLAVRPDRQRRGVGSALMYAILGAAEALDEPLVVLLGSPAYYGRFGFTAAAQHGIVSPDPAWGPYFQVRLLSAGDPPAGAFAYAKPFRDLP